MPLPYLHPAHLHPALPCRAFIYRRFAAGNLPPLEQTHGFGLAYSGNLAQPGKDFFRHGAIYVDDRESLAGLV